MTSTKYTGKETLQLRLWFLLPMAGVLLVTVLLIVLAIHRHATKDIDQDAEKTAYLAEHLYQEEIESSAGMLGAAMEVLAADQGLRQALARRDRTQLLHRSAPLFAELKKKYSITHFYFSDSERANILRVHQPARFGDTINRATTLQAQRSKQTSYGVELGTLGTFTLRLVTPWFAADGRLVGFVELGMEIDHVLRRVEHIGNVNVYVLINKKFIDRKEWEAGMRMLGRSPDWDHFPDAVVNNQARVDMPKELIQRLNKSPAGQKSAENLVVGASTYRAVFLPLKDAAGNSVGRMVLLMDVSSQMRARNALTQESIIVGSIAGATLLGLFFWLLGVVGRRLERNRQLLRELNEELEQKVQERTRQLLAAEEALLRKERLATLGQIAGSVGHELRNPLGVMNNAVFFLKTVLTDADDTTKEYLKIIEDEIAGSERIVSDLLDSVRTKPPHPQFIQAAELIHSSLEKLKIPENVTISVKTDDPLPIKVDPLQMRQVFINLIKNGVDAMPGGGELAIEARLDREAGKVRFKVRDTGTGISPDSIPKLFHPLYTTKARGIGLGLVVVKNLTEANEGKVEVESELGKGTSFIVSLPVGG